MNAILAILLLIFASSTAMAQTESKEYHRAKKELAVKGLALPTDGIDYPVSKELMIEAVRFEAKKRWDVFAIGDPIPCCGRDGRLVAYQVPVAVGQSIFPPVVSPLHPDEIQLGSLKDAKLWATDSFWTFVVSASENHFPIPVYFQGLPGYLVTYHKAAELATKTLNDRNVKLNKYLCLTRGDYFQFTSESGDSTMINAHTLKPEREDIVLNRSGELKSRAGNESENSKKNEIVQDQIKEEWRKVRNRSK